MRLILSLLCFSSFAAEPCLVVSTQFFVGGPKKVTIVIEEDKKDEVVRPEKTFIDDHDWRH